MIGNLNWRWVAIGVAIMFGLNIVASLILVPLVGDSLPATATDPQDAAAALSGGQLALGALIGIVSFAIGGYIVGLKSPGRTVLEPGISAAIAVVVGLLLSGAFTLGNLLVGGWSRSSPACWAATWASGTNRDEPSSARRASPLSEGRLLADVVEDAGAEGWRASFGVPRPRLVPAPVCFPPARLLLPDTYRILN